MARRGQVFTRLSDRQEELLVEIGKELAKEGHATIKGDGEVNTSEVIRVLLGRADERLAE